MKLQVCEAVNNIIEDKTGQSIATCWGSQKKEKALAKEFVRRWNAFEKDGLVDELVVACEIGLNAMNALKEMAEKFSAPDKDKAQHNEHIKFVEAAIAKVKD